MTNTETTIKETPLYKLVKVICSGNYVVYYNTKEYIHATKELAEVQTNAIERVAKKRHANKYNYLKVIQQNNGFGWEDVSEYEATSDGTPIEKHTTREGKTMSLYLHDLKEYIFSKTGATRGIFRREKNN
jgi:hypothetical protein